MTLPAWRDWVFAIKLFAAAVLALFLAMWIDLPRPYWALSTVFITSQVLAGATRSKAGYRVYGTLLGAVAAVILVPNLVNAPELLALAIALWVGVCLYFSLLDRTPKSYVLMLAGYTAAIIGFPVVGDPGSIFDTAVARAEEITLGILCASLVSSIVLPQSVAPMVKSRLDTWFGEARSWSSSVLGRFRTEDVQARRFRLACNAMAFDALVTPLRYDMSGAERSAEAVSTLRQHMLMFLPVLTTIIDRIQTLEKARALPRELQVTLDNMSAWLASGRTDSSIADQMRHAVVNITPTLARNPKWTELLIASLAARLQDFIDLRQDSRTLQRHIVEGTPAREALAYRYTARAREIRHRDHGMALLSAVGAFIAVGLAAAFWIASGWPDGSSAPMMAAVGCSFFAALDDPAPQIINFANSAIIGSVIATIYLFVVLPAATSFEMLAIALAPGTILCGLLMTQPKTAPWGLGIAVNGFTLLALQENYTGDFTSFANSAIGLVVGMWIAAVVTRVVRSVGAEWSARRLRRINRNSLAEAAFQRGSSDGLELAALMLDRIGLMTPRLSALPPADAEWTADLLTEVRIGIDVVELRRARPHLPQEAAQEVDHILSAVGEHFQSEAARPPAALLAAIDSGLCRVAAHEEEPVRRCALLGLTDLRRGLFPDAPPYGPGEPVALTPGYAA